MSLVHNTPNSAVAYGNQSVYIPIGPVSLRDAKVGDAVLVRDNREAVVLALAYDRVGQISSIMAVNVPTGVQAVTDANGNPVVASLSGSTLSLTFANAADATSAQGTFTF